ncbi:MAG: outer membrane beta-barrel family protein, partial [Bacteroidales bacterium]|nr:outer membrane beta-barrel family protein [Bacteroidales bacterium]
GFIGNFTDKRQLSAVVNANNTNNRGFNDLSGSMMGNMRGGGGGMGRGQGGWGRGNGISTSYMAGVNGSWSLKDGDMDLGGNYLFSNTDRDVKEKSSKTTYLDGYDLQNNTAGFSNSRSDGHRFGIRLDHKISENTSILFEPRINFGTGSYAQHDSTSTYTIQSDTTLTNDSRTDNSGSNRNMSTSGFLLFRQKLGAPGRTLTLMGRYSMSTNKLNGINQSHTNTYDEGGLATPSDVNQFFNQNHDSYSLMGSATITQPLGGNLYVEANYMYSWNKSVSDKLTTDPEGKKIESYSNSISNEYVDQEIGANFLYQLEKFRAQLGFSAKPTRTHNSTANGSYKVDTTMNVVNWSPQAMLWWEIGENSSARMFYRGSSRQPGINQLITVADNSNPLAVSFGNPNLSPYFSHTLWGDYRYNNKKSFASFNIRFDGTLNKNPIVNGQWYTNGISYSMPMNGPSNASANINIFVNLPIAQSGFTIFNMTRFGLSGTSNYVGENIETSKYLKEDGSLDYNVFFADYDEICSHFVENKTNSLSFRERFRVMYRRDNLELSLSGSTRINHAEYTLGNTFDQTNTFNNQIRASLNWTWDAPGLTLKSDFDYNWYHGYTTVQPSEYILNAEIQKLLFKKKMTLALKCYDILGQAKNITVTDSSNYHSEAINNTLGRYVILSLTYRFGTFDNESMGGMGGGHGRMR